MTNGRSKYRFVGSVEPKGLQSNLIFVWEQVEIELDVQFRTHPSTQNQVKPTTLVFGISHYAFPHNPNTTILFGIDGVNI